jgi:hypothetical protein
MSTQIRTVPLRSSHNYRMRRAHRGQTLIIALAVLFVLLFIGGLFVIQIARNLTAASRSKETGNAQSFSEAGVNYCANQLTYSEEGADWRPAPTPPFTSAADPSGLTDPDFRWLSKGFTRVFFSGGRALVRVVYEPRADDPRSQYLRIEAVGRPGDVSAGDVDPTVFVQKESLPPQLRREQIAYMQLGLTDYLFFVTNKDRTSYENFIGTPHLEASTQGQTPTSGLRDPATVLGDPTIAAHTSDGVNNGEVLFGTPIRVNGNVRLGGDTYFYLSPRLSYPASAETILASGSFSLAPTRLTNNSTCSGDPLILDDTDAQVFVNAALNTTPIGQAILPSGCAAFSTMLGLVRDGSSVPDKIGFNRGIPRLDPMLMDTKVDGTGVLRYRSLTRDSGNFVGNLNTGFFGWGRGVYINNAQDLQHESQSTNGAYSLRADWLDPNAGYPGSAWDGPNYRPPAVQCEMRGTHLIFTRSDNDVFRKPDGTPITANGGKVIDIPLADDERNNYVFPDGVAYKLPPLPHMGDEPKGTAGMPAGYVNPFNDQNSYGVNVVVMLEGNVRLKGIYGGVTDPSVTTVPHLGRVHLTIVTGGTAYVEGNVLKGDGYVSGGVPTLERGSTCSIMAKDYVCVNTTMFMTPQNQTGAWSAAAGTPGVFDVELGTSLQTYDQGFSWGVDPASYQTGGVASPIFLLTSHRALGSSPSAMNLMLNPFKNDPANNFFSLFQFNQNPALPSETYALGIRFAGGVPVTAANEFAPGSDKRGFLLRDPAGATPYYDGTTKLFNTILRAPGYENIMRVQKDQNAGALLGGEGTSDYLFSGAVVAPLDIRIEAAMYAQEKSFFVIPGYAVNQDPNDTRVNFDLTGRRTSYTLGSSGQVLDSAADKAAKDVYPFYNEPTDVRITVFGAISENYTASMGDQAAWMAKWGYIPTKYGSSNTVVPDDHLKVHDATSVVATYNNGEDRTTEFRTPLEQQENITRGLRFLYDPAFAMPYQHASDVNLTAGASTVTRQNRALRSKFTQATAWWPNGIMQILPPTPRQPVCPSLLYFGDSDHPLVP